MGPREHLEWHGATRSNIGAPKVPFSAKMTKMPLVNLELTEGQTRSKSSQNNTFHGFFFYQTQASQRFLATLTKFDQKLISGGPKNPNFDPIIRTGWNQSHWEDYLILIPTTIHGLKSELERLRYHENWDNALIDAPLTSESLNFRFDCWIFKIHTFSKTGSQNISRGVKINPIHGRLEVASLERLSPRMAC